MPSALRQFGKQIVESFGDGVPCVVRVQRGLIRRLRQLLAALRIVIKVAESLGDAFGRNLTHLEDGKLRYVTPRRLNHLRAPAPDFGAGTVIRNNLG